MLTKRMPGDRGTERRSIQRQTIPPAPGVECRLALPFPRNTTLVKKIIDISEKGLSFLMDSEEGHFLPGTPFRDCTIIDGHKHFRVSAEVVYSQSLGKERRYRVGLRFASDLRRRPLALHRHLDYQVRPTRYSGGEANLLALEVSIPGSPYPPLDGRVLNFSAHGLAVELQESFNALVSGTPLTVTARVDSQIAYSGGGTAVYVTSKSGSSQLGISLTDGLLDVSIVYREKRNKDLTETLVCALKQRERSAAIPSDFRVEVSDLRNFLETLKSILDEKEKRYAEENRLTQLDFRTMVDSVDREAVGQINRSLRRIGMVVNDLGREEHEICRKYFQTGLHSILLLSPFFRRAYLKPLGYAGDYGIVNMLLKNLDEGDTLFAKVLSRQGCGLPVAEAHRNRISYLAEQINGRIKARRRTGDIVRVMSIGCGPSQEVVDVITTNPDSEMAEFTLIDFDPEALYHCQKTIAEAKAKTKRPVRVTIVNKSVRDLIKEARKGLGLELFDLIYCAGLYDYLTSEMCSRLTQIAYGWLKPEGQLIITNVSTANEYRIFMEYGLEWFLFHRSVEELETVVAGAGIGSSWKVECDNTGTNLFLSMTR